jgi:hypothetical protein
MIKQFQGVFLAALLLLIIPLASANAADDEKYPLKVSPNGRHIVEKNGRPFLIVADAAWQLLRKLHYADAVHYMDIRKSQSVNTLLIHLLPAQANQKNVHNVAPFSNNNDLHKPEPAYFDHMEKVIAAARERDLVIGIIVTRKSWNLLFESQGEQACSDYGAYVGKRFSKFPNVIWVIGEEENQHQLIFKSVSDGLKQYTRGQLVASFSSCSPTAQPDSVAQPQPDLKFIVPDSTVSVSEYAALSAWQKRIGQNYHKPFVISNLELPREVTDQSAIIRNQAWQSVLSSAAGFCHSSTIKNFHPTWKANITQDGAEYLAHFSKILKGLPWDLMQPDGDINILTDSLDRIEVSTCYLSNRRLAMLYIPSSKTIPLDLTALNGKKFIAVWYSPRTGKRWPGGEIEHTENVRIVPPNPQPEWDWILLIGAKN